MAAQYRTAEEVAPTAGLTSASATPGYGRQRSRQRPTPRGAGRPNARRRPGGLWEVRVTRSGERHSYYGQTAADAEGRAQRAEAQAREGVRLETVEEYLTQSWLPMIEERRQPSTYLSYERNVRLHVVPNIGSKRLDALTHDDLTTLYARLASGTGTGRRRLDPASVLLLHKLLKAAFRIAVRKGLCDRSPCDGAELPPRRKRERVVLTREQATALHDAGMDGTRAGALIVLGLTTAARVGELLALRWADVDLDGRRPRIHVTGTTKPAKGPNGTIVPIIGPPKTENATRYIDLTPSALAALRALGTHPADALLFPSRHGGPQLARHVSQTILGAYLRRIGLQRSRGLVFHSLRHTTATHLIEDGVPIHVVSKMLGHGSVAITLTVYAHVTGPMMDAARDAVVAMYAPRAEREVPRQPAETPVRELVAA